MRRVIFALLLAAFIDRAEASEGLDEKNGFRDAKFGMGSAEFGELKPAGVSAANPGLNCYTRPADKLSIGDARLAKITYCFWNDQLHSIGLLAEGFENSSKVLDAMQAAYGAIDDPTKETHHWNGKNVYLTCGGGNGQFVLCSFTNKILDMQKMKADFEVKDRAAKKAADDL